MTINFWSNVTVEMSNARATGVEVDDIANEAAPATLDDNSGEDPANGSFVWLQDIAGMTEVNDRIFRTAGLSAGVSFDLEGENTTDYGDYDTANKGTFAPVTFPNGITTFTDISVAGGEPEFADTTTIHDKQRKQVPTVLSSSTYTMESIWDVSNSALVALKLASDTITQRAFKFTFSTGQIMLFAGYVAANLDPTGSAQDVVKTSVTITRFGTATYYSS